MKCEEVIRECSYQDLMCFANIDTKTFNVALEVAKNIDCYYDTNLQDRDWFCDYIVKSKSFDIVNSLPERIYVCRIQNAYQWKKVFEIFEHCQNRLDVYHILCFLILDDIVRDFLSKQ